MNKSMLSRLAYIDRCIREGMVAGRLANCRIMAAEYEVSRKSILRDIDFLRNQYGAPIEYDPVGRGYYYREPEWRLPSVSLSQSDLFAISVARLGLAQYENTPVHDRLLAVFRKLEDALPDKVSIDPAWIGERISLVPDRLAPLDPGVWSRVADALQRRRYVSFTYRKPLSAGDEKRTVAPLHLTGYRGGWYLAAFCLDREAVRIFALSRMSGVVVGALMAEEYDFDYHEYMRDSFGIFRGGERRRIHLRFAPSRAPYVRERHWHDDQEIRENPDGGVDLLFSVNHLAELVRWILSWGSGVEVIGPDELRRMVLDELGRAKKLYQEG